MLGREQYEITLLPLYAALIDLLMTCNLILNEAVAYMILWGLAFRYYDSLSGHGLKILDIQPAFSNSFITSLTKIWYLN